MKIGTTFLKKISSTVSLCRYASHACKTNTVEILGCSYLCDEMTNIRPTITAKLDRCLHQQKDHPLEIIKRKIADHFHSCYRSRHGGCIFASIDNLSPIVTVEQNFDNLLVPKDHVSRSKLDNYYINSNHVLRSHTSAHEQDLIRSGWNAFINTGDCYRRDEIDSTHYPVFHQMEGVRIFEEHQVFSENDGRLVEVTPTERSPLKQEHITLDGTRFLEFNLKYTLHNLVEHLFNNAETRWVDAYFPFTHPSWELEVKLNGEWLEMLGCGILEQKILQQAGAGDKAGWAFGLGLERFAMKLFEIPDIRLFWSQDERFLSQFKGGRSDVKFKPFSKYPHTYKDISFWVTSQFAANDFFEIVRGIAGDVIEEVKLIDKFTHPKTGQTSLCYRIVYRAMDRTLVDEEVNDLQDRIRSQVETQLKVMLR